MTASQSLGIDLGALTVTVATDRGVTALPAPAGGPVAAVRAALAAASGRDTLCVAVPDAWLSGDKSGAASHEDVRHECEDVARTGPVSWTGQLAAVSAFAAATHGPGRYLVCDVGGTGVRVGACTVSSATVRVEATHCEPGGGWRDFDAAVRAGLPPASPASALPDKWYEQALRGADAESAAVVLEEAVTSGLNDDLETRVYQIGTGAGVTTGLKAGLLTDSFEPTRRELLAAVAAVRSGARSWPPDNVMLTGGLGWFPLAARTAAVAAGVAIAGVTTMGGTPGDVASVADPDAAARGALLFAHGEVSLAPPAARQAVAVPVHRFHDGLLKEVRVTLPWTESFATFPGGPLTVDREELEVTVDGKPCAARLPGLVPGTHQIGLRPAWPGSGVLVVRPSDGGRPHIVPLADLTAR
jgi:hypothetical protein